MSRCQSLLVGLLAACFTGCILSVSLAGSGRLATLAPDEALRDFDRVEASHAFEVEIRQGDEFDVLVEADDNVLEHLDVRVVGGTLELGLRHRSYSLHEVTMRAQVTLPELTGIELSGASRAELFDLETNARFEASLSGASTLHGRLRAGAAELGLSGASRVELSGGCDTLQVDLSGASSAQLAAFPARQARVEASGASQVRMNVAEGLSVSASGASQVRYAGEPPELNVSSSGGASVIPVRAR